MRGEYAHTVDSKNRLVFPAKLREELGEGFVIFKGLDECLWVYSAEDWDEFEKKISSRGAAKGRKLQRFYSANYVCEPDSQGRILIPQNLIDHAHISKDVIVSGIQNRVEIWDAEAWKRYNAATTTDEIADLMEELDV